MRLRLDGANMTGTLAIDTSGEVPSLTGALSIDRLDLNPYLASPASGRPAQKAETGWSKKPINLALLKKADARLALDVGALRLRNLRLGKTGVRVVLTGGALMARLDPITLYGGTGRAELDVDDRALLPRSTTRSNSSVWGCSRSSMMHWASIESKAQAHSPSMSPRKGSAPMR